MVGGGNLGQMQSTGGRLDQCNGDSGRGWRNLFQFCLVDGRLFDQKVADVRRTQGFCLFYITSQ